MAHGRLGARLMRRLEAARPELSVLVGRPVEFSGMQSVLPQLDPAVLFSALRMIDFSRPDVVVEAVQVPEPATRIVERAIGAGASVVTVSPALVGTEGPRLRGLAAAHGVGLYTDGALGFGVSLRHLLRALPAGDSVRHVVGWLRHGALPAQEFEGAVESVAHRNAGLASTLFAAATTTAEVTVDPGRDLGGAPGRGGGEACGAPGRGEGEACAVSECERVGGRVSVRVWPRLVPELGPFGWWPGWSSGLLVETGTADTLLLPRAGSDLDRTARLVLADLAAALRARHGLGECRSVQLPRFLIRAEAGHPGARGALLPALAARGITVWAGRFHRATDEIHAVTGPVPEGELKRILAELGTRRRAVPVPSAASPDDGGEFGPLLVRPRRPHRRRSRPAARQLPTEGTIMNRPSWAPENVDIDVPSSARAYDYVLGGTHNFEVDREMARKLVEAAPDLAAHARANRTFLQRAVRFLVDSGVRQFLDLGSGIPATGNVHEVALAMAPESRIVYVDFDEVAVAHSRSILAEVPNCAILREDIRNLDAILDHPDVRKLLDFDEPVAILMLAVLHAFPDTDDPGGLVRRLRDVAAPGSYLVISHATHELREAETRKLEHVTKESPTKLSMRSRAEITAFLDGFELVEPGMTWVSKWREDTQPGAAADPDRSDILWAGVGRKP
ncbi:SAM-dependent methyltransferase [Streptomyces acidiscabies]|uniref:SAM-dependent methyltransferase n=1 Tax=Streptomyces acidiscabies TaxID=42234 RepID=UPI00117EE479|nr:SAM-dependent methyltransferase [Streptomyces acidiscabies]